MKDECGMMKDETLVRLWDGLSMPRVMRGEVRVKEEEE